MPWVEPALRLAVMSKGAAPESTIVKFGSRVPAADAAFANATFGQACELDDSSYESAGHTGTATIPAAVAMAERHRISGADLILAIVAGYEVMYRLMAGIHPHHNARGFHSQSIGGPFAAATAAGRILGLGVDQLTHALAIAGSHACGPLEYDQSGGEVKRIHAGLGARGGVHSALLAQMGLTGPETIIEGKRGFARIFATDCNLSKMTSDFGSQFAIHNVWFKLHPAIGSHHTVIDACRRLVREHDLLAADIAKIRIGASESAMLHGAGIKSPHDVVGAQFSMAFSAALAITKPTNDLRYYMDQQLWIDPVMLALMDRVETYAHPDAHGRKHSMAAVSIEMSDGRRVETIEEYPRGTPPNPAGSDVLEEKARNLAKQALDTDQVDQLVTAVESLESLSDIESLTRLLVRRDAA